MGSSFDKGGSEAASDAAQAQVRMSQAAIREQRRQFDAIQALLAPFIQAGQGALPELINASSAGGLSERIGEILSGETFRPLIDERTRAAQGQLSAAGLMRSGAAVQEAARIPTDLALQLESMLFGRQQNLVGTGLGAATQQGAFGANAASTIGQLQGQIGQAMGQGIIGAQQAQAAGIGNAIQTVGTLAAIFFSDPRLKENMEPIGQIGPLTLYEWDWREGLSGVVGKMSIGFNADEVAEHYPQHVIEMHGFRAINYPELTKELEAEYAAA